jgi:hypothetical protein
MRANCISITVVKFRVRGQGLKGEEVNYHTCFLLSY